MSTKHLPWNPAGLVQVWMRVGAAVWQGQCVEDALAKLISLAFDASALESRAEVIAAMMDHKKKPLGTLLKRLRTHADIPKALDADLRDFLENRNWVVHESYSDVVKNLGRPKRLKEIIARIEQTDLKGYRIFEQLWDTVARMSDEYETDGISPTALAIRHSWKKTSPPLTK